MEFFKGLLRILQLCFPLCEIKPTLGHSITLIWVMILFYFLEPNIILCSIVNSCKYHKRLILLLASLENFFLNVIQLFHVFFCVLFSFFIKPSTSVFPFNPCCREVFAHYNVADDASTIAGRQASCPSGNDLEASNANSKVMKMGINEKEHDTSPALWL